MKIGVCTSPESLTGAVPFLEYIEGSVGNVLCPQQDDAAFERRVSAVRAAPAPTEAVNCLIPGAMKTTGPDVNETALDEYISVVLDRASKIGIQHVVYGSGKSRAVPEGFNRDRAADQIVGHLKRWAKPAERAGIVIMLEPLHGAECNIVNTVVEGAGLVRRVGSPAVRLLADTYHMARQGEQPDAIRQAGGLIGHVHCAEANGRGPLGTTGEDQRPYFNALKDIGYDGCVSIEAKWTDFAAQLPAAVMELRRQIDGA